MNMIGARVLILTGDFAGCEGMCLGEQNTDGAWPVSPGNSDAILTLRYKKDFGLLIDLSNHPRRN